MKKLFLLFTVAILCSFSVITYDLKHSTADVDQIEGTYIFVNSKPASEYEYLGSVKLGTTLGSGQFTDVRDALLKKLHKDYPQADGAIFSFVTGATDHCDAIKFK